MKRTGQNIAYSWPKWARVYQNANELTYVRVDLSMSWQVTKQTALKERQKLDAKDRYFLNTDKVLTCF